MTPKSKNHALDIISRYDLTSPSSFHVAGVHFKISQDSRRRWGLQALWSHRHLHIPHALKDSSCSSPHLLTQSWHSLPKFANAWYYVQFVRLCWIMFNHKCKLQAAWQTHECHHRHGREHNAFQYKRWENTYVTLMHWKHKFCACLTHWVGWGCSVPGRRSKTTGRWFWWPFTQSARAFAYVPGVHAHRVLRGDQMHCVSMRAIAKSIYNLLPQTTKRYPAGLGSVNHKTIHIFTTHICRHIFFYVHKYIYIYI